MPTERPSSGSIKSSSYRSGHGRVSRRENKTKINVHTKSYTTSFFLVHPRQKNLLMKCWVTSTNTLIWKVGSEATPLDFRMSKNCPKLRPIEIDASIFWFSQRKLWTLIMILIWMTFCAVNTAVESISDRSKACQILKNKK